MGGQKSGRKAFSLKLDADTVRVRKAFAPVAKPHEDLRRKKPRRRPDHLAEIAEQHSR